MTEDRKIRIAVHNGNFHADDCTAFAILSEVYPNNDLIRTRDPVALALCDFRIDVGGQYDGTTDFDHHQRDFAEFRPGEKEGDRGIKYASAGLIWKHFGRAFIASRNSDLTDEQADFILREIDEQFIRYIDANDNGITLGDENLPTYPKIVFMLNYRYGFHNLTGFRKGADMARDTIAGYVEYLSKYLESEAVVLKALKGHEGEPVLLVEQRAAFQEVVNRNWDLFEGVQLLVYPEIETDRWRVKSLGADPKDRFKNRCLAPVSWRGLSGEQLEQVSGIQGAEFVHPNGFTGGGRGKEETLAMARKWYELTAAGA